ncbi:MATE family efflux transporter [Enterococcus faecalis]|uniref:MATE family efflux transporter n=1 Tax=Enterococcus faecalis TaxID=1351 RepID=UPI003CC6829E
MEQTQQNHFTALFYKNVLLGILSMAAQSIFILADTFFIANGIGTEALAGLNIVLPLVNIINGLGWMFGVGGATLFSTTVAQKEIKKANQYFSLTIGLVFVIGSLFTLASLTFSDQIIRGLQGTGVLFGLAKEYYMIYLSCSLLFILNNCLITFLRNDHNPRLATIAFVSGGIVNIILDYVFIYQFGWGMAGAAIATVMSPLTSLILITLHKWSPQRVLRFEKFKVKFQDVREIMSIGFSSFLNEFSSAFVMFLFNIVLLNLVGHVAISAYAIVANLNIIVIAIFTGIGQGAQPLLSRYYGLGETKVLRKFVKLSFITYLVAGFLFFLISQVFTGQIIEVFNSEGNDQLAQIARTAIRLYAISFLFTGLNFMGIYYFSAVRKPKMALMISSLRGFFLIVPVLFILVKLLGLTGVWLAMPVVEFVTFGLMLVGYFSYRNYLKKREAVT